MKVKVDYELLDNINFKDTDNKRWFMPDMKSMLCDFIYYTYEKYCETYCETNSVTIEEYARILIDSIDVIYNSALYYGDDNKKPLYLARILFDKQTFQILKLLSTFKIEADVFYALSVADQSQKPARAINSYNFLRKFYSVIGDVININKLVDYITEKDVKKLEELIKFIANNYPVHYFKIEDLASFNSLFSSAYFNETEFLDNVHELRKTSLSKPSSSQDILDEDESFSAFTSFFSNDMFNMALKLTDHNNYYISKKLGLDKNRALYMEVCSFLQYDNYIKKCDELFSKYDNILKIVKKWINKRIDLLGVSENIKELLKDLDIIEICHENKEYHEDFINKVKESIELTNIEEQELSLFIKDIKQCLKQCVKKIYKKWDNEFVTLSHNYETPPYKFKIDGQRNLPHLQGIFNPIKPYKMPTNITDRDGIIREIGRAIGNDWDNIEIYKN